MRNYFEMNRQSQPNMNIINESDKKKACPQINVFYNKKEISYGKKNKNPRKSRISFAPLTSLMKKEPSKKTIKSSKKIIIRPQNTFIDEAQKLFKYCIEYYTKELTGKKPYEIKLDEINNLGKIYYILKYQIFENKFIKSKNENENKYHFINEKNEIVENIFLNKYICENLFIDDKDFFHFSQFINEFSQKIKITSQISDISVEENNGGNKIAICDGLKKFFCVNKVNKEKINDYKAILILKGKRVVGNRDYNMENLISYSYNKRGYDLNQNNNKTKDYFIQLYLGGKALETVKIKNDEDISNINSYEFNKIMDFIKFNEEIVFVFLYYPLKYFNINSGLYKFIPGVSSDYETIFFINCSKRDSQLYEIFKYVDK